MRLAELFLIEAQYSQLKYWFHVETSKSFAIEDRLQHFDYVVEYPEVFGITDIKSVKAASSNEEEIDFLEGIIRSGWVRVMIMVDYKNVEIEYDLNSLNLEDALAAARYYSKKYYPETIVIDYKQEGGMADYIVAIEDDATGIKNFLKRGVVPK